MSALAPIAEAASVEKGAKRLKLIDALRGVAATWVLAYHLYNAISPNGELVMPSFFRRFFTLGEAGVQVFFVLSGFVIASNLYDLSRVNPGTIGRFMLRRSVRLDPLYWAVIALNAVFLATLSTADRANHLGPLVVLANMFYVNGMVGLFFIVPVGWTLTFEVQFYLALAIAVWLEQSARRALGELAPLLIFGVALGLSVWQGLHVVPVRDSPWATPAWHMFFIGVACAWLSRRRKFAGAAVVVSLVASLAVFIATGEPTTLVAVVTGAAIAAAAWFDKLGFELGGRPLQWLGKTSYSLYLLHPLIGNKLLRFASPRVPVGETFTAQAIRWACLAGAAAACMAVAWTFWRFIEKPTQRLSRHIRVGA